MKWALFVLAFVSMLTVSGCVQSSENGGMQEEKTETPLPDNTEKILTMEEVTRHAAPNDCWMVISGKVYDFTDWIESHPGGQAILQGCGKDGTGLFETRPMGSGTPHSSRARNLMENYLIGDIEE